MDHRKTYLLLNGVQDFFFSMKKLLKKLSNLIDFQFILLRERWEGEKIGNRKKRRGGERAAWCGGEEDRACGPGRPDPIDQIICPPKLPKMPPRDVTATAPPAAFSRLWALTRWATRLFQACLGENIIGASSFFLLLVAYLPFMFFFCRCWRCITVRCLQLVPCPLHRVPTGLATMQCEKPKGMFQSRPSNLKSNVPDGDFFVYFACLLLRLIRSYVLFEKNGGAMGSSLGRRIKHKWKPLSLIPPTCEGHGVLIWYFDCLLFVGLVINYTLLFRITRYFEYFYMDYIRLKRVNKNTNTHIYRYTSACKQCIARPNMMWVILITKKIIELPT
jgi:hypothetical protein